ncbi:sugar phosphate isomerase [Plantactinospora sp. BC1]|uniref:EboA domain-containing protein n=1 Tax=Plantactinospora sp. BC1 TaxID=2108470 RepID=UPI000D15C07E|nr:EboA domain-containing protein [Plantactinospora sp. BC1]AVT33180.1 sugar phosphate isomerase [Plantactinospora sp. BC1]
MEPEPELERLRAALLAVPDGRPPDPWLAEALRRVGAEPSAIGRLFAAAGRRCGRAPLPDLPHWSADDAARVLLLGALPPAELPGQVEARYREGDAAEKRAVLRALPLLPVGDAGVPLLHDAIRTNDTRLVAAALGPYADRLDQAAWRQAVLKCVFTGIPLAAVHRLDERADAELAGMLAGFADERRAAGREMPADATALLDRLSTLDRSGTPTGPGAEEA